MDDFATWKRRKGFIVDVVYTDDANVGSTTTSIKNYLQGLYDNATTESPAPSYVLFVGDVAQIPAFYLTASGDSHYSDLSYCCWTGNDYLPDCYYGRFSAQNLEQLLPQISKTLMYEQYTFPDDSYLSTAALIAGVDGGYSSDYAYRYADPTMDYIAKTYVTTANGFNNIYYYKNNTAFAPTGVTVTGSSNSTATATALRNLYNSGCGWVNYSAHGGETSWSTPSFTNTNVAAMTNNNKPMVMIGNCCLTNSFQVDACFGEALLRKGNNAGAVSYIGGSNSTYWTEDFYWSVGLRSNISNTCDPSYDANNMGMYDKLFHTHNEATSAWHITLGAMIYAGNMAVQSSSSSLKEYYWQIYHLMGDPSLMPYNKGQASPMNANVPSVITLSTTSLTIQAVPYAYVGFTDNNHNLIAAGFADAAGNITLSFNPITSPENCEVVITAQNYQPFIQTVSVITNGPYTAVTSMTPTTPLTAGEEISFDLTLKNIGTSNASSLSIEFQTNSGHILLDTTGIINLNTALAPGDEINLSGRCSGLIWGHVTDQTTTPISVIVRWGNTADDRSTSTFNFVINADKMKMQNYNMSNIATTSATLTVTNSNIGHATMNHGTVTLICLEPSVCLDQNSHTLSNIAAGQTTTQTYQLSFDENVPQDHKIPFLQTINNGSRTERDTLYLTFGHATNEVITFEDNSWGDITWTQGTYPWELTNQGAYAGNYCIRSKTWANTSQGNNKNSELSITWTSSIDDSIVFYRNVSSENNYDFFRFYIDNVRMEEASGTDNSWTRRAYFVAEGTHTFKFSYEKDQSVSNGSDCAWIDNLKLPYSGISYLYSLDSICEGNNYTFNGTELETSTLSSGLHQFADSTDEAIRFLTLWINAAPEVTIEGGDVTIRSGESVRLTASGAENYLWDNGATSAIIDVYPTETTTYSVTGFNGNCSATVSTTITVDGTLSINGDIENRFSVYPNPAHHYVTIDGDDLQQVIINDINGRQLMSCSAEGNTARIDISSLPNGIYLIQAIGFDGQRQIHKLIKK